MNQKYRIHKFTREASIDSLAYQMLQPLLKDFGYMPLTGSALRPSALVTVLNDIVINNRVNIVEFGCGISTFLLAKFAKMNGAKIHLFSVEEDKNWMGFVSDFLKKNNLQDAVTLIHAPIEEVEPNVKWHNLSFVDQLPMLDCVLVDGPKAIENKNIRSYALDAVKSKLASKYAIFLDDCHRKEELEILNKWSSELGTVHEVYYQHLGVIFKGQFYNIAI